jgi:hypothetical protein
VVRGFAGRAAPLVVLSAALVLLGSGCGDLSRGELSRGVESLSALAAQGSLVADGVAEDATKSTYARVMAKTLGGEAEHEAEKLADAEPEEAVEEGAAKRLPSPASSPSFSPNCRPIPATSATARSSKSTWPKQKNRPTQSPKR